MRKLLIGAALAAASLLIGPPPIAAQSGPAAEIITLVNELRAANGLPAYQVDSALMAAAQAHTEWSAATGTSTHTGQGGTTPNDRAQAAGYGGGARSWATENSAGGTLPFITPQWVVTMWQGDDVHLRAMISPDYEHIGVGYAEADGYAYYTMMVGWVADAPAPAPPEAPQPETAPLPPEAEAAVVATATPAFVLATPGPDGSIVHEVQAGQSVWQIAAYYEVEVDDLLALNGLTADTFLHAGDTLVIRPADAPQDEPEPTHPATTEEPPQPTAVALELPPKLTPVATLPPPPEADAQQQGMVRKLATVAIVALGVVGVALAGWALRRRRRGKKVTTGDNASTG